MKITYYGHSCFNLEMNGKNVLIDPFITPNALASHIDINQLKPDFILLSHGHGDHVADVETIYNNSKAKIISTYEVCNWFQNKKMDNVHHMNHGGKGNFDFGLIKLVNAVHSSSMPDGSYGGHPAGFVLQGEKGTFYYAGDTALHQDMKQIGEEFKIDFAFMPIGDNFTMGIEDALKAADYVGTKHIIGMHYDTFPPIEIDKGKAQKLAENSGKKLTLMEIGKPEEL